MTHERDYTVGVYVHTDKRGKYKTLAYLRDIVPKDGLNIVRVKAVDGRKAKQAAVREIKGMLAAENGGVAVAYDFDWKDGAEIKPGEYRNVHVCCPGGPSVGEYINMWDADTGFPIFNIHGRGLPMPYRFWSDELTAKTVERTQS